MSLVDMVRARIDELAQTRSARQADLDSITATVEGRGDANLTPEETARMDEILAELRQLDADRKTAEARLAELETNEANRQAAQAVAQRVAPAAPAAPFVQVNDAGNDRVYSRGNVARGASFLRDVMNQWQDPSAAQRLAAHMNEEVRAGTSLEARDGSTSSYAGLVVPQYLTELVAPKRRAGRPVADIATKHVLPATGNTVNISRITTGSTTAVQASENGAVSEQDIDDTLLTVNVRTIAGQQDVSRQALDRGVGVEEIVLADLVADYNRELDDGIINDDGTSGTHLGIRSTSSIIAVTYTDASPTVAEAYPKFADLIQQVQAGVYMGVSHFVMHPRRWWWIASAVGSTFPFLNIPGVGTEQAGSVGGTDYAAMNRQVLGVPVVLDGNMVTNLGAGTNEDVVIGVTADELHLWEDPNAPLFLRAEQTAAGNLTVKFVLWGYSAFTAGRYPGAHGTIGGTGFVAPSF